MDTQIKGFKHLRPGAECAILRTERFGRGREYRLATIKSFDVISGEIEIAGTARTFGMDGYELGYTDGEPRQRLIVPVTDEIREIIFKAEAKTRIQTLLYNWKSVDIRLIRSLIEAIDSEIDSSDNKKAPGGDASKASLSGEPRRT